MLPTFSPDFAPPAMARRSWAAELAPAMARAVALSKRGPGLSDTEVWLGAERDEKRGDLTIKP